MLFTDAGREIMGNCGMLRERMVTLMPGVDRLLTVRVSSVRVDADGEAATLSIITDDTERRAAEDLVRRSETLLSHLVSTSPDWITLTEFASGRYAMVNPTFLATTGYRNDSPYSVTRHLRDAHSAALMIGNERIHAGNGSMHLMYRDDAL